MPLDPSISLQVKPPVIDTPDMSKTFLTLSQMKYLNAETARTQVQAQAAQETAAREQAKFAEKGAEGQLLSSLSGGSPGVTTPAPPAMGLPQPASTASAPPGPPQPPMDWTSPEGQAMIRRVNPHGADETITKLVELRGKQLDQQKLALETTSTKIGLVQRLVGGSTDQQSYDLNIGLLKHAGIDTTTFPPQWTPDLPRKVGEGARTEQQRIEQAQKNTELATQRLQAGALERQAGAAETTAAHKQPIPTATGFGTFNPVTGTWERATTPAPAGGSEPLTAPAQAERAQSLNSGWMNAPQNQQFLQTKQAHTDLQTAKKLETGVGDMAVVSAYNRVLDPSGGSSPARVEEILKLGTLTQQAQRELKRLFSSGEQLSPTVRQEIVTAAEGAYKTRVAQHQQHRGYMLDMSRELGVTKPETVIPDLSTETTAAGPPGRTISLSELDALMQHPQAQGKTRAQVVSDLASKGIRVRPDEGPR